MKIGQVPPDSLESQTHHYQIVICSIQEETIYALLQDMNILETLGEQYYFPSFNNALESDFVLARAVYAFAPKNPQRVLRYARP